MSSELPDLGHPANRITGRGGPPWLRQPSFPGHWTHRALSLHPCTAGRSGCSPRLVTFGASFGGDECFHFSQVHTMGHVLWEPCVQSLSLQFTDSPALPHPWPGQAQDSRSRCLPCPRLAQHPRLRGPIYSPYMGELWAPPHRPTFGKNCHGPQVRRHQTGGCSARMGDPLCPGTPVDPRAPVWVAKALPARQEMTQSRLGISRPSSQPNPVANAKAEEPAVGVERVGLSGSRPHHTCQLASLTTLSL